MIWLIAYGLIAVWTLIMIDKTGLVEEISDMLIAIALAAFWPVFWVFSTVVWIRQKNNALK